jgi:hypothetical protein
LCTPAIPETAPVVSAGYQRSVFVSGLVDPLVELSGLEESTLEEPGPDESGEETSLLDDSWLALSCVAVSGLLDTLSLL